MLVVLNRLFLDDFTKKKSPKSFQKSKNNSTNELKKRKCGNCGEEGHNRKNCPSQ